MLDIKEAKIGVIGLGYVGLPLAIEFGRLVPTVGFDIRRERIEELDTGVDKAAETEPQALIDAGKLHLTSQAGELADCNVFILAVPTPIDRYKRPDLGALLDACRTVGKVLGRDGVVIVESTVYPGATEEACVPVLEESSGLKFNHDFFVGYSPERMNPGDKEHTVANITKVTSGSTPETAEFVDRLYRLVVKAGTFRASSIKVAEAAKVIENTQRDLNIALINELALIFHKLGIDTGEILAAAATKWNFLPFRPGLVGGHCIGVDPYYLTHKAQEIGYHPEVILAGRRINDNMGTYVAERVIKLMTQKHIDIAGANILIMGLSFKENCADIRNTRVVDIIGELQSYGTKVEVYDPWVASEVARSEYDLELVRDPVVATYDAVVIAVAHDKFKTMGCEQIRRFGKSHAVVFDVKSIFPRESVDGRL